MENEEIENLYEEAKEAVTQQGYASTSLIQRRLRIGYGVAAALMDMLEARGIVGPMNGAKPRELLTPRT